MAVDLLCHVSEKRKTPIAWDRRGKGTKHHRRKILPLVDNNMAVAPWAIVCYELLQDGLGEIIPVVVLASRSAEFFITFIDIENYPSICSRNPSSKTPYTLGGDINFLGSDPVLGQPSEFFDEELDLASQNAAGYSLLLYCRNGPTAKFSLEVGAANGVSSHTSPGVEITTSEFVVVHHVDALGHHACKTPQIGNEATIKSQENRWTVMVRSPIGKEECPVNRQRGFPTAGSTQYDRMPGRGETKDLSLPPDWLGEVAVHLRWSSAKGITSSILIMRAMPFLLDHGKFRLGWPNRLSYSFCYL